jgi:antitoxin ParD1/3/4
LEHYAHPQRKPDRRARPVILAKVASGKFENASEVVRAALRALDRDEREYEARLAAVRAATNEGDASPDAAPGVFERIRAKHGLPLTR